MAIKIAIVGGGPGGLCLANILQRNNIAFTLFEGDKSQHERTQGGSLDLHPESGQRALREAGLWDLFAAHARPEADVMKVVSPGGQVLWDGNGPDKHEVSEEDKFNNRPEIDREKLRDILFERLNLDNVRFGMHVREVVTGDGKYDIVFKDGTIEPGYQMVIGADGAWSKIRKLLTDELPHYSGISALELWLNNADIANPWLSRYVGAGSCFCFGEGRSIQIQRLGDDSIRLYACLRKPETFLSDCGIDFDKPDEAREQYVKQYYGDCGEDLKRVLRESNSKLIPRQLFMLPVGFRWEPRTGITLLGDAAHVMTPFAGVGVNAALADALELATCITKAAKQSRPIVEAIEEYEPRMFVRAEKFAQRTYQGLQGHFSANGSENFAKKFRDHYQMKH